MTKKPKKIESKKKKESYNAKMIVIAIIFVMIFVSFAVIITTQEGDQYSKNMVFNQDNENLGRYYGNIREDSYDFSFIKLKIKDESSSSTNETTNLEDGTFLDTEGNFTLSYSDSNSNGKLDPADEFVVENANEGDKVTITFKSSDSVIAFYIFSEPF
jgi:hypothetical protein